MKSFEFLIFFTFGISGIFGQDFIFNPWNYVHEDYDHVEDYDHENNEHYCDDPKTFYPL